MELTVLNIGLVLAAVLILVGYVVFLLVPAWRSYGRIWERMAASFLTLFMLATLLAIGLAIGFSIVWFYDNYA
ncbi:MAG TPA: hypothetical protein VGR10_03050 [Thermoleophilaceae bacterium]|nr:hypothetical protein [Thermoleophilaceae bacterium]